MTRREMLATSAALAAGAALPECPACAEAQIEPTATTYVWSGDLRCQDETMTVYFWPDGDLQATYRSTLHRLDDGSYLADEWVKL